MNHRGQARIVVPHQFHRFALRDACPVQVCAKRVPQRVEINYAPSRIDLADVGCFQMLVEKLCLRYQSLEHKLIREGSFEERASHEWMTSKPMSEQSWAGFQVLARV